jgi:hypothetical protein
MNIFYRKTGPVLLFEIVAFHQSMDMLTSVKFKPFFGGLAYLYQVIQELLKNKDEG